MLAAQQHILHSDYGKSSRELIHFVSQLRALGAHIDLELPRIVVIGNQSAGKSSLVEAISGISVPRDAGTCTRCPMECRLQRSAGDWSCQIKIRWEYADDNVTRRAEVDEVPFGRLLTDKLDVEPMLRRAQAAVLNPRLPLSTFVTMSDADLKAGVTANKQALLFSRNVVCIELTGPELVDLSFVDLPGIVQNADIEVVQLVEDLVKSYISGRSLILVTLPMSDDIENQKAARLANLADPKGSRTIGVMTKPDTLTAGSTKARDLWLEVIEGRRHPLFHGYYCTRQPDDDERSRGISGADARAAEAAFFQETAPWASSTHKSRFGTTNLVQSISKLLTEIIRAALPELLSKAASQLEECTAHLQKLPAAITAEPTAFVVDLITQFGDAVALRVRGSPTDTALVRRSNRRYEAFKLDIRATAPPFLPFENAAKAPQDVSEFLWIERGERSGRNARPSETSAMYLQDVRKHISASVTRELPGNVPYAAKMSLLQAFQRSWEQLALKCFDDVQELMKASVTELLQVHFNRYATLHGIVRPVVAEQINIHAASTIKQLRTVLELETSPYTQNEHYFSESRDKWLAKYKDARATSVKTNRAAPTATAAAQPASSTASPNPNPFAFNWNSFGPSSAFAAVPPSSVFGAPATNTTAAASSSTPRPPRIPRTGQSDPVVVPQGTGFQTQPLFGVSQTSQNTGSSQTSGNRSTTPPAPPPAPVPASTTHPFSALEHAEKKRELLNTVLAGLVQLGYTGIVEEDLGKLNPPDTYEDELQVMAEVRAYFQVAYKRVIDYIPLSIDHQFLYALEKSLKGALFERLGLGGATSQERCKTYIAEDADVVSTREELLSKKKRLENVQRAIYQFGL